jgi:hypothetical protein
MTYLSKIAAGPEPIALCARTEPGSEFESSVFVVQQVSHRILFVSVRMVAERAGQPNAIRESRQGRGKYTDMLAAIVASYPTSEINGHCLISFQRDITSPL